MSDDKEYTIKMQWEYFRSFQMGGGLVAFRTEHSADPVPMSVHDDSESNDDAVNQEVEKDCRELVRLLGKFSVARDCLTENTLASAVVKG